VLDVPTGNGIAMRGITAGQGLDYVAADTQGLLNFGWDVFEGHEQVEDAELTGDGELVDPIATYAHDVGCSITGGYVYRGSKLPELEGRYLYGDYCSGTVWSLRVVAGSAADIRREQARLPTRRLPLRPPPEAVLFSPPRRSRENCPAVRGGTGRFGSAGN